MSHPPLNPQQVSRHVTGQFGFEGYERLAIHLI